MGAVPKKKLTRSAQGGRASHYGREPMSFSKCPRCNQMRRPHRACANCGYYHDRQVLVMDES